MIVELFHNIYKGKKGLYCQTRVDASQEKKKRGFLFFKVGVFEDQDFELKNENHVLITLLKASKNPLLFQDLSYVDNMEI